MAIYMDQADQHTHTEYGKSDYFLRGIIIKVFWMDVWFRNLCPLPTCPGTKQNHQYQATLLPPDKIPCSSSTPLPAKNLLEVLSGPPLETLPMDGPSLLSFSVITCPSSNFWLYLHYKGAWFTMGVWNPRIN